MSQKTLMIKSLRKLWPTGVGRRQKTVSVLRKGEEGWLGRSWLVWLKSSERYRKILRGLDY